MHLDRVARLYAVASLPMALDRLQFAGRQRVRAVAAIAAMFGSAGEDGKVRALVLGLDMELSAVYQAGSAPQSLADQLNNHESALIAASCMGLNMPESTLLLI